MNDVIIIILVFLAFSFIVAPIDAWLLLKFRPEKAYRHRETMRRFFIALITLFTVLIVGALLFKENVVYTVMEGVETFSTVAIVFLVVGVWIEIIDAKQH